MYLGLNVRHGVRLLAWPGWLSF